MLICLQIQCDHIHHQGNGPVHLVGSHCVEKMLEEEEEREDEAEESQEEDEDEKAANKDKEAA